MKKKLLSTLVLPLLMVSLSSGYAASTLNTTASFAPNVAGLGVAYETQLTPRFSLEGGAAFSTEGVYHLFGGVNTKLSKDFYIPARVGLINNIVVLGADNYYYASVGLGAKLPVNKDVSVFAEMNSNVYPAVTFPQPRVGLKLNLQK